LVSYQAIQYKKNQSFKKLTIEIHDIEGGKALLNKAQVLKIMRQHLGFDPAVSNIESIDLRALEGRLEENLFIKQAIIYINSRHEIKVEIFQRKPIARVKSGNIDYYMAADGKKIPTSNYKTLRVPLISGGVKQLTSSTKEGREAYKNMLNLVQKIEENTFLNALVEQIDLNHNGKITLIPKIGSERIEFGDLSEQDEKLYKLEKYYEWGKNQDGWDKYAYLNLEYKDQVTLGK
jgi:cell division protein FtsQ